MRNGRVTGYGFTLIELLVVLLIVALLASVAAPVVTKSISRAKESALRENLHVIRKAIDDYYADKGRYPLELQYLVDERYLRNIPPEPISDDTDGWIIIRDDTAEGEPGIIDLKSGADSEASNGTRYSEW